MQSNNVNPSLHIDIQKNGITPDNRCSYTITRSDSKEHIKLSVKKDDADSFEKSISAINALGETINDPKEMRKNKIKAYSTLLGLSTAGIAIPAYLTRKSKLLTKSLSIVGGAALGVIGGLIGFVKCSLPKGLKDVQSAQQTLQSLDVRIE